MWVCLCGCGCVCDLKDFLHKEYFYLYTSKEDTYGRSQSFHTDSPVPPKMKYKYIKIIQQWENDISYK